MKMRIMLMVVASLLLANGAQADLLHYYNFGAGSGTTVYDQVGSRDGVFEEGKTEADWVAGKYGGGLEFNGIRLRDYDPPGVDGPQWDVVDFGAIDMPQSGTIMMWINQDSGPAVDFAYNANWFLVNGQEGMGFQWIFYNQPSQGINLCVELCGSGQPWPGLNTSEPIATDKWVHVACSWDAGLDMQVLYVNGIAVNMGEEFRDELGSTTDNMHLGGDPYYTNNGRGFDGTIDELRIFDCFLDEAGVQMGASFPEPEIFCGDFGTVYLNMDFNQDCYVDLRDFAEFVAEWLHCTDPQNVDCDQYWK